MSDIIANLTQFPVLMVNDLPGCEPGLILNALKEAGRDFCIQTEAWRVELAAMNVVASQVEYRPTVKQDAAIHRVYSIEIDDVAVNLALVTLNADGRTITLDTSIEPQESITNGLIVSVVLRPYMSCAGYDEWFLDRYAETIKAGALSKLMLQPKKPWSDPQRGMDYRMSYGNGLALARRETIVGHRNVDVSLVHNAFI